MACDVFSDGFYVHYISPKESAVYYTQSKPGSTEFPVASSKCKLLSSDCLFLTHINSERIDAVFSASGVNIFCERFDNMDVGAIIEKCRERIQAISDTGIIVKTNNSWSGIFYIYNDVPTLFNTSNTIMLSRLNNSEGDVFMIIEDPDRINVHSYFITPDKYRFMEREMPREDMSVSRARELCADFYRASLENLLSENEIMHMISMGERRFLFGLSLEGEDRYIGELPSFWASKRQNYIATFLFEEGGGMNVGKVNGNDIHIETFSKNEHVESSVLFALIDMLSNAEKEHVDPTERSYEANELKNAAYFPDTSLMVEHDSSCSPLLH